MLKRKAEVFAPTDGVIWLCRETPARMARGADWTGAEGLAPVVELPCRLMRVRADDVALAAAEGRAVTVKAEVRRAPGDWTGLTALFRGRAHDVTRSDEAGGLAYLCLSELASDGTCELVSTSVGYDALGQAVRRESSTEVVVRSAAPGDRDGSPVLRLTVRTADYAGEVVVRRSGTTYSVTASSSAGGWTALDCAERRADR